MGWSSCWFVEAKEFKMSIKEGSTKLKIQESRRGRVWAMLEEERNGLACQDFRRPGCSGRCSSLYGSKDARIPLGIGSERWE